jgi:putative ABC transport system permease protein
MRLVDGRNFSDDLASDSSAVILNEAAVAALGLGPDPVGRLLNETETPQEVVGVVSDFHFQSLRDRIEPVVLTYAPSGAKLAVQFHNGQNLAAFLDRMQARWQALAPEDPIRYSFLDDNFAALAAQERMLGRAVAFFTLLALVIAAMGLLGLVAFAVQRRTKEIGVRKVLGASVPSVVALLSRQYLLLVGVAFVIAAPAAYVAMAQWLNGFVYRIDLGPGLFALAGGIALAIALLAVGGHALRAATADPVKALRTE